MRFADQEQEGGASHGGPGGGLMGAQGGPQAYSQEPIYTPRILRDPGEPVNRTSQPHVQFDMGGVITGYVAEGKYELMQVQYIPPDVSPDASSPSKSGTPQRRPSQPPPAPPPGGSHQVSSGHILTRFHPNFMFRVLRRDLLVEGTLYHHHHLLLPMSPLTLATLVHIPHEMTKLSLMSITEIVSTFYSKG